MKREHETAEHQSEDPNDASSRFDGTTSGASVYAKATPMQHPLPHHRNMRLKTIKKVIGESLVRMTSGKIVKLKNIKIRDVSGKVISSPQGRSASHSGDESGVH